MTVQAETQKSKKSSVGHWIKREFFVLAYHQLRCCRVKPRQPLVEIKGKNKENGTKAAFSFFPSFSMYRERSEKKTKKYRIRETDEAEAEKREIEILCVNPSLLRVLNYCTQNQSQKVMTLDFGIKN